MLLLSKVSNKFLNFILFYESNHQFLILDDETLMDPVVDEYERHEGSITCIKCSPIRNLFVTAGTDKEIRIYHFEEVIILPLEFIFVL